MKHLTGIAGLTDAEIGALLDRADNYADALEKGGFQSELLRGAVIINMFFEASTRTRTSFELAALRLGAGVINWDAETSALKKGETFADTIAVLNAMKPDAVIIRHSEYGAPEYLAKRVSCAVINAGDSYREHPTQALLDALTIRRRKGRIEGLTVTICGDIAHSRVAASNMILLSRLGACVRIVAPAALMPDKLPAAGIEKFDTMKKGLPGSDIVMMLRPQKERMQAGLIDSDKKYFEDYGLTREKLDWAGPEALVMHPGPLTRGIEIADDVADDPKRSLILQQVANGVAVRMAALDLLLSARKNT